MALLLEKFQIQRNGDANDVSVLCYGGKEVLAFQSQEYLAVSTN